MTEMYRMTLRLALFTSLILGFTQYTFSQAPEGINYQAVARTADGTPLADTTLDVSLSIASDAGLSVIDYSEVHSITTNRFGLFNLIIGDGTPTSGSFQSIDWGASSKFLNVEIGSLDMGITQLMSVPYALYAENSGNTFSIDSSVVTGDSLILYFGQDSSITDLSSLAATPANDTISAFELVGDSLWIIEKEDTFYVDITNFIDSTNELVDSITLNGSDLELYEGGNPAPLIADLSGLIDQNTVDSVYITNDTLWVETTAGLTPYVFLDNDWEVDGDSIYVLNKKVGIGLDEPRYAFHVNNLSDTVGSYFVSNVSGIDEIKGVEIITTHASGGVGSVSRGMWVRASGAVRNEGIFAVATSPGAGGSAIGVRGAALNSPSNLNYGVYGEAGYGNINRAVIGVLDTGFTYAGSDAAIYGIAQGQTNGGGRNIAVFGRSIFNNTTGANIGIYSRAQNADTNYAAYFESGAVYIGDSLVIPSGAQPGYVLTSDAGGNASWELANDGVIDSVYTSLNGDSLYVVTTSGTSGYSLADTNIVSGQISGTNLELVNNEGQSILIDISSLATDAELATEIATLQAAQDADSTYLNDSIDQVATDLVNEINFLINKIATDSTYLNDSIDQVAADLAALLAGNIDTVSAVSFENDSTLKIFSGDGDSVQVSLGSLASDAELASLELQININQDSIQIVDAALAGHIAGDLDIDTTNELITATSISGDTLYITEGGVTTPTFLGGLSSDTLDRIVANDSNRVVVSNGQADFVLNNTASYIFRENVLDMAQEDANFFFRKDHNGSWNLAFSSNSNIYTPAFSGNHNFIFGRDASRDIISGSDNISLGNQNLRENETGNDNIALGRDVLTLLNSGSNNVALGANSGNGLTSGNDNIFLGSNAGVAGSYSNRLYIGNTSLLYGEFDNDILQANGTFRTSNGIDTLTYPTSDGSANDVLITDGAGNLSFVNPSLIAPGANDTVGIQYILEKGSDANGDSILNLDLIEVNFAFVDGLQADSMFTDSLVITGVAFPRPDTADNGDVLQYNGSEMIWAPSASGAGNFWDTTGNYLSPSNINDSVAIGNTTAVALLDVWGLAWLDSLISFHAEIDEVYAPFGSVSNLYTDSLVINNIAFPRPDTAVNGDVLQFNGSEMIWAPSASGVGNFWDTTGTILRPTNLSDSVGIGTTDPDAQLGVVSSGTVAGYFSLNGNNGADDVEALKVENSDAGTGEHIGILSETDGNNASFNTAIKGVALNADTNLGVNGFAFGGDMAFGLVGDANTTTVASYGVRGVAHSFGDAYGVYGTADGATNSYAGYFDQGAVFVGDSLIIPSGASNGFVLTSDAAGNASWQAPSGGANGIADVLAIDNDAGQDSIFNLAALQADTIGAEAIFSNNLNLTDTLYAPYAFHNEAASDIYYINDSAFINIALMDSASVNNLFINGLPFPDTIGTNENDVLTLQGGAIVWSAPSASPGSGSLFELNGTVVRDTGGYDVHDFVFGSPQLDDSGNPDHNSRMFFDKSKSAFRAGIVEDLSWNDANMGTASVAFGYNNIASGTLTTISGGSYNLAQGTWSTIAGGDSNTVLGNYSTVGGGAQNTAGNSVATVAGGAENAASGPGSSILGGGENEASGTYSSVGGGFQNKVGGLYGAVPGGTGNVSQSYSELVIGLNNDTLTSGFSAGSFNATDRLFVIGNGSSGVNRSNAMVMLKNGNTTLNGELTLSDGIDSLTFNDFGGSASNGDVLSYQNGDAVWAPAVGGSADNDWDTTSNGNVVYNNTDTVVIGDTAGFARFNVITTDPLGAAIGLRGNNTNNPTGLIVINQDEGTSENSAILANSNSSSASENYGIRSFADSANYNYGLVAVGGSGVNNSTESYGLLAQGASNNGKAVGVGAFSTSTSGVSYGLEVFSTSVNDTAFGIYSSAYSEFSVSYAGYFDQGNVFVKDTLQIDSILQYNHQSVQQGYYLRTNADGTVYADTLSGSSCPSGFVSVNDDFCIQQDSNVAASWFQAALQCNSLEASLPTLSEWYVGVQVGTITARNTNVWEWIDGSSSNNVQRAGGGGSDESISMDAPSNTNAFRCVYRLK